jgi:hypothetical protein
MEGSMLTTLAVVLTNGTWIGFDSANPELVDKHRKKQFRCVLQRRTTASGS